MSVLKKLETRLNDIHIEQKLNSGNILTKNDIEKLFKILKQKDVELKPVLIMLESLINTLDFKKDYKLLETVIIDTLKYYNIIEGSNFINCRHKYFFSDDKKLIKTKFFTEEHVKNIESDITLIIDKL